MADYSLDDYIGKKNFRVQINNPSWNNRGNSGQSGYAGAQKKNQGKPGYQNRNKFNQTKVPVTVTGLGNVQAFDARQRIGPKITFDAREKLQNNKPVDARLKLSRNRGQGAGQGQTTNNPPMRQQVTGPGNRQLITGPAARQTITGPGVRQQITGPGVRQKIKSPGSGGIRQAITAPGVRQKIAAPGNSSGSSLSVRLGNISNDARGKIISLKSQKGRFDARSRINAGLPAGQTAGPSITPVQVPSPMGNVQPTVQSSPSRSGSGSKVWLTSSGLQVSRAVPDATVSFEGSMLTVTKRAPQQEELLHQQEQEQVEAVDESYEYTQEMDYNEEYEDENDFSLETEEFKPQILQIKKTIKTVPAPVKNVPKIVTATAPKRKAPHPTPVVSSGPLKLFKAEGHIPVIAPQKKAKMASASTLVSIRASVPTTRTSVTKPKTQYYSEPTQESQEEEEVTQDVMSPLQGFRVYVTNLHPVVTQDDIIELFGAIGALRKAKLVKQGTAEVVYIKKEDAIKSVQKYHNRELDGLPMQVKLLTSVTATVKQPTPAPPAEETTEQVKSGPLKLLKQVASASAILRAQTDAEGGVELPLVHKALFKLGGQGQAKPVTFTVKI